MDLVDFVRARLDEDEEMASAASPGPWATNAEHDEVTAVDGETVADGFALSNRQLRATVDHIARHDPSRVLSDVDSARRTLVRCQEEMLSSIPRLIHFAQMTVWEMAQRWSDHKEFREDWRP